jgi:hypothetical protein
MGRGLGSEDEGRERSEDRGSREDRVDEQGRVGLVGVVRG